LQAVEVVKKTAIAEKTDFVDVVGQFSLKSLERAGKKKKQRKKRNVRLKTRVQMKIKATRRKRRVKTKIRTNKVLKALKKTRNLRLRTNKDRIKNRIRNQSLNRNKKTILSRSKKEITHKHPNLKARRPLKDRPRRNQRRQNRIITVHRM